MVAHKSIVLAMLVGGLVLGLSSRVGAGGDATFEYSPTSGPPGTVIQVSGGDCGLNVLNEVVVVLSTPGEDGSVIASVTIPVMNDGTWTGTLTVPDGTPPGDYDLQAFCTNIVQDNGVGSQAVDPPANVEFIYLPNPGPFAVTGAPSPPTTVPPVPVEAAPAFTG